jgi:hypothetical protein
VQSVILSFQKNGKEASWKNLDKVWQLVYNEPEFRDYVKHEIAAGLAQK